MKCPECQFENPSDTRFCGNCGTKIMPFDDLSNSHTKTSRIPIKDMDRGTTIANRYEIIEELGRGGMGNVYRVVDKKINEEMALKLLHPAIAVEEKTIERFKNELKLSRKITHKNVCRMYDLNEEGGTPFITMEYVPGEDLKSMIKMTGQLSVARAVYLAKQICEGLAEAHHLGVVHRDLKSRNIMVDKEGNAKIMDFGIARSLKAKGITGDGIMVGTPEYMSPEQVKGEEVDQRSDIYSLGIVLFEMVAGKIPFEGDTSLSIALKHKTEEPPNPQDFNAQIPGELSTVILKCLNKEKDKRYQNTGEVFSELVRIEEEISSEKKVPRKKKTRLVFPVRRYRPILFRWILPTVFIALIVYLVLSQIFSLGETKWKNSIAVLPIKDQSLSGNQERFCEGMTEALISGLRILYPDLRVIPPRSVMKYKDSDKGIQEIGKELQIATILESSLQIENNIILLSVHLSSTKDGSLLWSRRYSREFESYLEVQNELSKDIAISLKIRLAEDKLEIVKKRDTIHPRALECYVTGKHYIETRYRDSEEQEDFEKGLSWYEKAIEIDPNYALAYWGLGNAYESHFNATEDDRDRDLMRKSYEMAYQIDTDLPEANLGLGWVHFYELNWDMAYQYYKRAFELDPNSYIINCDIGSFFRSIGLYRNAIKYYGRAIDIDRSDIVSHYLFAICSWCIGEYEEADSQLKKALEIDPEDYWLHLYSAESLIMMKKFDEAEREIAKAEEIDPSKKRHQHFRAWILAAKGEKEKALALIKGREPYFYEVTSVYSLLGMKDEAIKYIREGIEKGLEKVHDYLYSYPFLVSNPYYDNLRDDPRFVGIVSAEKKKYDDKMKKYKKF